MAQDLRVKHKSRATFGYGQQAAVLRLLGIDQLAHIKINHLRWFAIVNNFSFM